MLKIQVLGTGLIPRGYGLAPRKEPFNADYTLIQTIMAQRNLSINYQRPEDGKFRPLTRENLKKVWDKYNGEKKVTPAVQVKTAAVQTPSVPAPKNYNTGTPSTTVPNQSTPAPANEKVATPAVTESVKENKPELDEEALLEEEIRKEEEAKKESNNTTFKPVIPPEEKDKKNNKK